MFSLNPRVERLNQKDSDAQIFSLSSSRVVYLLGRDMRELEGRVLVGELLVHRGEGVELVLKLGRCVRVKEHLEDLAAIDLHEGTLAEDLVGTEQAHTHAQSWSARARDTLQYG